MDEDSSSNTDSTSSSISGGEVDNVYKAIFREIEDAIFLIDVEQADGDYTFTFRRNNAAHQRQTGLSEDSMRGQTPREILGEEQGSTVASNYRRCVEEGDTIEYEEALDLPGGTSCWKTKLTPITEQGEVIHIVGVARDITDQKEREQTYKRTYRRFETVLETMSAAVFLKDVDGQYLLMNQACRDLFDVDTDPIGMTDGDLFPREIAEQARSNDLRVIENGEQIEVEETVPTATGGTIRLTRKSPVYDDEENIRAVCGVSTDITAQREREQTLEETKQRLTTALKGTDTGVWEWNLETDKVVWTESMERLFGIDQGTFEGTYDAFAGYVHPDDLSALEEVIERTMATGEPLKTEYRIQTGDDRQLWVEGRAELIEAADGSRRMVGVISEITSRKEYETALEATREELRKIIDLVPDLIFVKDRDGQYLLANETTAESYGKTPEEVEGKSEAEIIPDVEDSEEFRQADLEVIESGEPKTIAEETLTTAAGETRILQTTKIPYQVPETGEDAVLGYARDVTDLKEYEQTLEEQRDNLTLLNQVVRHDIRNQLMVVESYTELLEESLTDDQSRTYARTVIEAARQATDITKTAKDVTEVLLQVGADRSLMSLRDELSEQIAQIRSNQDRTTVAVDGSIADVEVLADELLEAVFRNLLTNAVIHNDKHVAEITVSTRVLDDVVRVSIADNGPGISEEHKEQIFQEGSKGLESSGTGVGLFLVKTLVDRYRGTIWVEDNEPTGSVFVVELPIDD